jgi:putative DNA primase/helicase
VDSSGTVMMMSDDPREPGIYPFTVGDQVIQITRGFNLTELGNAERMVALFGDELRYCKEEREWYTWNGIRWVPDRVGTVQERAKDTVRTIYAEATLVQGLTKEAEAERVAIAQWAHRSEAQRQVKAMIEYASTDTRIAVRMSDLDGNKRLINCPNGTIDLDARVFREHERADLLTKVTLAPYDPRVKANLFFSTLTKAMPIPEGLFMVSGCLVRSLSLRRRTKNGCMFTANRSQ